MNLFARFLVLSSLACLWFAACGPVAPKTSLHQAVQDGNLYLVHVAREKRQAAVVQYLQQQTPRPAGGRGLIDGGLGVSELLDNP